jgi:hypothetical protein
MRLIAGITFDFLDEKSKEKKAKFDKFLFERN